MENKHQMDSIHSAAGRKPWSVPVLEKLSVPGATMNKFVPNHMENPANCAYKPGS